MEKTAEKKKKLFIMIKKNAYLEESSLNKIILVLAAIATIIMTITMIHFAN